jgi:ribosome biogenesis GTPase A
MADWSEKHSTLEGKRCPGCGVPFQSEKEDQPGYVPPTVEEGEKVVCRRCFGLIHYGILSKAPLGDESLFRALKSASARVDGFLIVCDVSDPETLPRVLDVAGNEKPVLTVLNKADLLLRWMTPAQIEASFVRRFGLHPGLTIALSARDGHCAKPLRELLQRTFPGEKTVLALGATNAGKSTLLSILSEDRRLSVSRLPGTTLGEVTLRTSWGLTLLDYPGFKLSNPFLAQLCPQCLVAAVPRKRLFSKGFELHPGMSYMFGGLGWIRVLDCGSRGWVKMNAFVPEDIPLHRTKAGKERELLDRHSGDLFRFPCRACWDALKADMKEPGLSLRVAEGEDLVFPALGWVAVQTGEAELEVVAPEGCAPLVRSWLVDLRKAGHRFPRKRR